MMMSGSSAGKGKDIMNQDEENATEPEPLIIGMPLDQSMGFLFEDPITLEMMNDAVMINCGHSFDAESLNDLLARWGDNAPCPACKRPFVRADIKPNYKLREAIERYRKDKEGKEDRQEDNQRLAELEETARRLAAEREEERRRLEAQNRQLEAQRRAVDELEAARRQTEQENARLRALEDQRRRELAEAQAREEELRREVEAERARETERARREAEARERLAREREEALRRASAMEKEAARREREASEAAREREEAREEAERKGREEERARRLKEGERERRRAMAELEAMKRRRQEVEEEMQRLRRELAEKAPPAAKTEAASSAAGGGITATLWSYIPSVPVWSLWGPAVQYGPLVRKMADYRRGDRRGARKNSPVWKITETASNKDFAIKRFQHPPSGTTNDHPLGAWREAMLHHALSHPNIMGLQGVMQGDSKDEFYMILPFVENDLEHVIDAYPEAFNMAQIRHLMFQLLLAVSYLHSSLVAHRDLQPANIMMSKTTNGRIWLSSMNRARSLTTKSLDQLPHSPYLCYRAPELLLSAHARLNAYDWTASDVWSCGCIFAQLFSRRPPFMGTTADSVLNSILDFTDCRQTLYDMPTRFPIMNTHSAFGKEAKSTLEDLVRGQFRPRIGGAIDDSPGRGLRRKDKERDDDDEEGRLHRKGSASTSKPSSSSSSSSSASSSSSSSSSAPGSSGRRSRTSSGSGSSASASTPGGSKNWSEEDEEELQLALELLRQMLCFDPGKRITAKEALEHEYFARHREFEDLRRTKKHLWSCPQDVVVAVKDDRLPAFVGEQCAGLAAV